MNEYLEFLNLVSLYNELLSLDSSIKNYTKSCENNKDDEEVLIKLTKRVEQFESKKREVLITNGLDSYIPLLCGIIDRWEKIVKKEILFNIDINTTTENNKLPLYGLIQSIVNKTQEFKFIYKYIIENELYDPNHAIGVSDEPFFSLLPNYLIEDLKDCNNRVLTNPNTDFHILRNGTDMIEYALISLKKAKNKEEKEYWENYIMWSLNGSCSILDSKRFTFSSKKFSYEYKPTIMNIFSYEFSENEHIINFLLTEEAAIKQYDNSLYPSKSRNDAIDFYVSKLNINENIKRKLVSLKI